MRKVSEITAELEKLAPTSLAEDFDNVGLLVGRSDKDVTKVMIMLDLDKHTLDEAINFGADLIITHHPVIFSPMKSINDNILLKLIENNIAVYSAHTNLDSAVGGVNDALAEKLQLKSITEITLDTLKTRMGDTDVCTLGEFISKVKELLEIKYVRYVGDLSKKVQKVAVLGGSGADLLHEAKDTGCDVYVTAELKYHQAKEADDIGLCIIDAGHFETEIMICKKLYEYLSPRFRDLDIAISNKKESYIHYE